MQPAITRSRAQVPPPDDIPTDESMYSFSRLMDNMVCAATNNKAVLEELVTTTTTQYASIKALLQELKRQHSSNNSGRNPGSDHTPDGDDMR